MLVVTKHEQIKARQLMEAYPTAKKPIAYAHTLVYPIEVLPTQYAPNSGFLSINVLCGMPVGGGGNHNNMPVKVVDAPASPPRALGTGRGHSTSFSESESSGPHKSDQVSINMKTLCVNF